MKFTCERCGKKYATAEDPAPGRVYKLKCKSCGHLIVVKGSSAAKQAAPPREAPPVPGLSIGAPSDLPPELQLEIGAPEPARPPNNGAFAVTQASGEATTEISMASITSPAASETETPPPTPAPRASEPPGYVDLFADVMSSAPSAPEKKPDDPFLAAARASLPEGFGGGGAIIRDPFAPIHEDSPHPHPPARGYKPPPTPKIPAIPKPTHQKSALPIALIAGGVAVLVGILAFTLYTFGKKDGAGAGQAPVAQAPVAASPKAPAQQQPPVAPVAPTAQAAAPDVDRRPNEDRQRRDREEAKRAAEERAAKDREAKAKEREERAARDREARDAKAKEREERAAKDRQAREERAAKDRQAREERAAKDREAREARDRDKAERIARERAARDEKDRQAREAREERDRLAREAKEREKAEKERLAAERVASAASAEPEGGLTSGQVEKVLSSTKKAFDGCIQAAKGSDVKLDGRRVMLRLNIQTTGAVTYPTLDDVTLNSTELGQCLKNAARLMVFPKFKGDTMHVEVPLVLTAR